MGGSAENRQGLNNKRYREIDIDREHPHSILLTPHDTGVIRDSVDNESYSPEKELRKAIHRLSTAYPPDK